MHRLTFDPNPRAKLRRRGFPGFSLRVEHDFGDPWKPYPERPLALAATYSLEHDAIRRLLVACWESSKGRRSSPDDIGFVQALHLEGKDGNHRLLGGELELQSDMRLECQALTRGIEPYLPEKDPNYHKLQELDRRKSDWVLLAKLDSDKAVDWCWGDAGSLYYWIRKRNLTAHRFNKVHGLWQQA